MVSVINSAEGVLVALILNRHMESSSSYHCIITLGGQHAWSPESIWTRGSRTKGRNLLGAELTIRAGPGDPLRRPSHCRESNSLRINIRRLTSRASSEATTHVQT
jgi:hypothetical protein